MKAGRSTILEPVSHYELTSKYCICTLLVIEMSLHLSNLKNEEFIIFWNLHINYLYRFILKYFAKNTYGSIRDIFLTFA